MSRILTAATYAVCVIAALQLSACGTPSKKKFDQPAVAVTPSAKPIDAGGYLSGDGPGNDTPAKLDAVPDAIPKTEPLHRYANRPYVALGKTYIPLASVGTFKEKGIASWYGKKFHGQRTSVGEVYDMYAMTAAHPTLPIPSYARVTNLSNHKSVVVRVNDRGPFLHDRVIDLSYTAAYKLGIVADGSAEVEVESISTMDTGIASPVAGVDAASPPIALNQSAESNPPASAVTVVSLSHEPPVAVTSLSDSDAGIFLQLGAFKSQSGAEVHLEKMRAELHDAGKPLKLVNKDGLVRVQIGPYANEAEARSGADSMEGKLGFKPMLSLP
ncbi:MAG: septal ring lytic transglycosylase RlpA family protein [Gallionella sp.]